MTLKFTPFILFVFYSFSGFSQAMKWMKKAQITINSQNIGSHISMGYKDLAIGPDGKIYSTGYFYGTQMSLGNISLTATPIATQPSYSPLITGFIACHDTNGNALWAKKIYTMDPSDVSLPTSYLESSAGLKLGFDTTGNILLGCRLTGDTLFYENSAFAFFPGIFRRVCILKISPTGNLIWGKCLESIYTAFDADANIFDLSTRNGLIEVLVNGNISTSPSIFGPVNQVFRFDTNGNPQASSGIFGVNGFAGIFPGHLSSAIRLKNKRYLLNHHTAVSSTFHANSLLTFHNADFSVSDSVYLYEISDITGLNTVAVTGIQQLPSGEIIIVVDQMKNQLGQNAKLIFGNDTLDVPKVNGAFTWSLVIKLSDLGCMKTVKPLPFFISADIAVSPNGNMAFLGSNDQVQSISMMSHDASNHKVVNIDRNGEVLAETNQTFMEYSLLSWPAHILYAKRSTSKYHLGSVYSAYGPWLMKTTFPDPLVPDQSFSGCLSNRALLLNGKEQSEKKSFPVIFEISQDRFRINGISENLDHVEIYSVNGKKQFEGFLNDQQNEFYLPGLPSGIYSLKALTEKGKEINIRFIN